MNRKKGAAIAVIAVVAVIGGLAAYANMSRQVDSNPPPILTTINRSDGSERNGGSTMIAEEKPEGEQQAANTNGTIAENNNTVIANNTIVINKPVYRNNTIIYQPVTINLENYRTTINQHSLEQDEESSQQPADRSHRITIHAERSTSEGWSDKFIDDGVGMFAAVYDINGGLVKTGYADERGFTVRGLEDKLYFVFPADCTNCSGKNDILFQQWEDGSKDRPRLVPADSEVTASYRLAIQEKPKQVPLTPPQSEASQKGAPQSSSAPAYNETETAAEPEITLQSQNATFVYGWVQLSVQVNNMVEGYNEIAISVYTPDGTLHDSFSYSSQQGFFVSRETGEGNYRIVVTYEYGEDAAEAEITHPIKFATPEFVNLAATEYNGTVSLNGRLKGGLAGENITIAISGLYGEQLKQYNMSFGTRPVFSLFIAEDDFRKVFNETANYTFTVTHVPTGVTGNVTLFHGDGEEKTQTAAMPLNVSNNLGRSAQAMVAAQGNKVYLVWEDNSSGQHEILFAKSEDAGETFSEPVEISQLEEGGFAQDPDIVVSGDNVYIVWADYDSDEESTAALVMSDDGGNTFDNKTTLGSYIGEGADPRLALFRGDIYVSWIIDAEEEFTGNLMIAKSSDGDDFEAALVAEEVDTVSIASSDDGLYLSWLHYPTGDSSEEHVNMFAKSENGINFQTFEGIEGVAVTSLAAAGNDDGDLYAGGFANETVIFAKSENDTFNNTTEISSGTLAYVMAWGDSVYLAWAQDNDIFLATSSDGGETFSEPENLSESEEISYWPRIAIADKTFVVWTEGARENADIMILVR